MQTLERGPAVARGKSHKLKTVFGKRGRPPKLTRTFIRAQDPTWLACTIIERDADTDGLIELSESGELKTGMLVLRG